ncbi:Adventitious rooting related oxygenase [Heracleum sosnowskyi]|uniref:2-oxoglutarate-dependent dioxygenase DAO n=1 Tax=Heracleum sosnowskyi TaxID=360622 RepID=A0AAD8ID24_9APIA|nr:Adventitious rooting related oxygenase [Heracleum sosnowskyi]
MASNFCTIPVIDLQDFPAQSSKLVHVCQEWGCFRLVNHQNILSDSLMSEMKSVVKSLFDLPPEIKLRNTDVIAGSGYMAPSQINPLYETFGLYISSQQDVDVLCSRLNSSPYQRETLIKYAKAVHELFVEISGKLADGLGISGFTMEEWPFEFRINKYHFAEETVGSSGVQIHTDSSFLTILQDDEVVGGLEVMDMSGAFIPVDPWPSTLVVNLGDVGRAWSNGRLCTVTHRVQCKEASLRYSIASFLLGPKGTVEPPEELVDATHPRLFSPFNFEDYRKLRYSTKLRAGEALDLLLIDSSKNYPGEK